MWIRHPLLQRRSFQMLIAKNIICWRRCFSLFWLFNKLAVQLRIWKNLCVTGYLIVWVVGLLLLLQYIRQLIPCFSHTRGFRHHHNGYRNYHIRIYNLFLLFLSFNCCCRTSWSFERCEYLCWTCVGNVEGILLSAAGWALNFFWDLDYLFRLQRKPCTFRQLRKTPFIRLFRNKFWSFI